MDSKIDRPKGPVSIGLFSLSWITTMTIKRSDEKAKPSISGKQPRADKALSDDQLGAVAGGTTFRVDAETEPSHIIDPRTIDIPHKNLKGK
jgi:hypothetical protein